MPIDLTRQLHIIHLSDLHFGNDHRFMSPSTTTGDTPLRSGFPSLIDKLRQDFEDPPQLQNLVLCLTGDFATNPNNFIEFRRAEEFIKALAAAPIHGAVRGMNSIFLVPGNHDVSFDKGTISERWERYIGFVNRLQQSNLDDADPLGTVKLHNRVADLGALILCLNSAVYVEKGSPNEHRGEVDQRQLERIDRMLSQVPKEELNISVRIALIHHHPVLIPALAEPGRGYDAVENSGLLLQILRNYGFHLILHGHKHNPYVFTEDSQSAWTGTSQPIVIVAGGSVGSTGIPEGFQDRCNCYNRITIKWHPAAGQSRVSIETRGLSVFQNGREDLPYKWQWRTLREYDLPFFSAQCMPKPKVATVTPFNEAGIEKQEQKRMEEYSSSRGNMAVVEVLPSLVPGQAYEARLWIVPHPSSRSPREVPLSVTWSAGPKFPVKAVTRETDAWFTGAFHYWGPMLVQARLQFEDGGEKLLYVYAWLPQDCTAKEFEAHV
jgi:3',5'-cyclic AMP phosphodiesterase CpdA